jgi:hypothetical protein
MSDVNILAGLIKGLDRAKSWVVMNEKMIMEILCNAIRDVIPDIKGRLGYPYPNNPANKIVFYSEQKSKALDDGTEGAADNRYRLSSIIESVFPELEFSVDDHFIYLSEKERVELTKILNELAFFWTASYHAERTQIEMEKEK